MKNQKCLYSVEDKTTCILIIKATFILQRTVAIVVTSYLTLLNVVKPSKLVKDQARDIEIICTIAETPDKISIFFSSVFHRVDT